MPDEPDESTLPKEGSDRGEPVTDGGTPPVDEDARPANSGVADTAPAGQPEPWEEATPPSQREDASLTRQWVNTDKTSSTPDRLDPVMPTPGNAAQPEAWPPRDEPTTEVATPAAGDSAVETAATPARSDLRLLSNEVRRLAAQIANGRA